MNVPDLVILSVGLAMDAAAVSVARGLLLPTITLRHVLLVAAFFGGFQAVMPILGYALGATFGRFIQAWDHWIVFILLAGLGIRMLKEAFVGSARKDPQSTDPLALPALVALAFATSVDALAAGITLPLMGASLLPAIATIGTITAALSVTGLCVGKHFGSALGRRLDVVGGLALIGLGIKTLVEHLTSP